MQVIFPPPALCTDNGVMVAWAAIEKFNLGLSDIIEDQDVFSRWPIGKPVEEYGTEMENIIKMAKKKEKR